MQIERDEDETAPPEVARGRQQVIASLVTLGGSFVLGALLGGLPIAGALVWLFVLGMLGIQVFRGTPWARYVLAALAVLLGTANGHRAFVSLGTEGAGWALNAALALTYTWVAVMLAASPAVRAFGSTRRAAREVGEPHPPE